MAAFKDLSTPSEIQNYLLNVLSRMTKNGEMYLYHYSRFSSIAEIIKSGYLWLGLSQNMNDYLEGEFIESVDGSNRVFFACFSRAEENLAMYKMYAQAPDGAMMIIPLKVARQMIENIPNSKENDKIVNVVRNNKLTKETTLANLYWSEVVYKDLHTDTLRTSGSTNSCIVNPLLEQALAGFVKLHGWEYEREVRLVALSKNSLKDYERIALKLPDNFSKDIIIVTAPGFKKRPLQKEISMIKRMGVQIQESAYDGLVGIFSSVDEEKNQRISELELENNTLRRRIERIESASLEGVLQKSEHNSEIRHELEKEMVDYSIGQSNEDKKLLKREPWRKFLFNNLILRSIATNNPSYNDGLIKVELYDLYGDGVLVFDTRGGGTITVREETENGGTANTEKEVYILETVPFSRIYHFDRNGSENYPYPTLYCRFEGGNPFGEKWYIDKNTGKRYHDKQVITLDWDTIFENETGNVSTRVVSADRKKLSLYACIIALFAAENDGIIKVLPTVLGTSFIAGRQTMERNQKPRELARWEEGVSQLLGQGYTVPAGKKNVFRLTNDGYILADQFKKECNFRSPMTSAELLSDFGVPDA